MTPQYIEVTVGSEIVLYDLPARTLERITTKLSLPNPKYISMKRFAKFMDESVQERVYAAIESPPEGADLRTRLHCPRGSFDLLREEMLKDSLLPKIVRDDRTYGSLILPRDPQERLNAIQKRDYQEMGMTLILTRLQGLILLPPASGKTLLACLTILRLGRTTLVIVPTVDIAEQWEKDLLEFGFQVGIFGGGFDSRDTDIVIAINDSLEALCKLDPKNPWFARFGFVVCDECHHSASTSFQRVLRCLPARWRIGLTASLDREDGLRKLVEWSFGPVLLERTIQEMIRAGWLEPANIELVETDWYWHYYERRKEDPKKKDERLSGRELTRLEADLASAAKRNTFIVRCIRPKIRAGKICAILVRRVEHAKELAKLITEAGTEAIAITSKMKKSDRKEALRRLREGELQVACGTSLLNEGIDIPRLGVIGLAAPARAKGETIQKLGRLMRKFPGKKPDLVDFIDPNVPILVERARARKRVYKEAGLLT
jgi:superfamily II DNA or RNA helicase